MQFNLARLLPLMTIALLAGCSDVPTLNVSPPSDVPARSDRGTSHGIATHLCYTSERTTGGALPYRYARKELTFPRSASTDRILALHLSIGGTRQQPDAVAKCVIPNDREALREALAMFGVTGDDSSFDDGTTVQDCIDGTCALEPLVVVVTECPNGWILGSDNVCRSARGGGATGGGGDIGGNTGEGGGGDSSDPGDPPPPGIDEDYWSQLNAKEKEMCRASLMECVSVFNARSDAESWAAAQDPTGAHNGPQDALRHAKWNANMTKSIGAARAEAWGNAHELSSTVPAETRMDLHNNAVGRQIGQTWTDVAAGVLWARDTGQLCLAVGSC